MALGVAAPPPRRNMPPMSPTRPSKSPGGLSARARPCPDFLIPRYTRVDRAISTNGRPPERPMPMPETSEYYIPAVTYPELSNPNFSSSRPGPAATPTNDRRGKYLHVMTQRAVAPRPRPGGGTTRQTASAPSACSPDVHVGDTGRRIRKPGRPRDLPLVWFRSRYRWRCYCGWGSALE